MTLNLVPTSALSAHGTVTPAPGAALPAMAISFFLASSTERAGATCQLTPTKVMRCSRPIHVSCRGSYLALGSSTLLRTTVGWTKPGVVPSCGATLKMYSAARTLDAPGMFCGTTVGLPGTYRFKYCATRRPAES